MFATDSLYLGQTRCVWDRLVVFGTDSLCLGQTCLYKTNSIIFGSASPYFGEHPMEVSLSPTYNNLTQFQNSWLWPFLPSYDSLVISGLLCSKKQALPPRI